MAAAATDPVAATRGEAAFLAWAQGRRKALADPARGEDPARCAAVLRHQAARLSQTPPPASLKGVSAAFLEALAVTFEQAGKGRGKS